MIGWAPKIKKMKEGKGDLIDIYSNTQNVALFVSLL